LQHALTTAPIVPTIWRLALPNGLAMTAAALVSIAETWYVGQLGIMPLAGMALVFPLVMLQQMLSAGSMGGGITSAISRALGANNSAKANALVLHAALIALVIGIIFTFLFSLFGHAIFSALGGKGEALEQCLLYSHVVFAGSVSIWLTNALAAVIRGSGNMRTPSKALLVTCLAQVILSAVFGLGLGPVPKLGMSGIAAGVLLSFTGSALYFVWFLRSENSTLRLSFSSPLSKELFSDILKVGGISSISTVLTVATILIVTRLISNFGPEALAGFGIGTRLEFLLVPMTFAFGVACLPMVGMALGAQMVDRAKKVAWTGALMAAALVGCIGLLVTLWPGLWANLFSSNIMVLASAGQYFRVVGPCYGFFALGLCLYFASQGAGKLWGPVMAGTFRLVLVSAGGVWLSQNNGTAAQMFMVIAIGMVCYGVLTAITVWKTNWAR
jgi:putative MATE family efflux protein